MFRPRRTREEFLGGSGDEDGKIQYGVRRSRRNTTFEYRDSSSLTPAQFMEQEVYYARAEEAMHGSLPIAHLIFLLLAIYHRYLIILNDWHRIGNVMTDSIASMRDKIRGMRVMINRLIFILSWIKAYGEIALLYAEDLSIYVCRRNRFHSKRFWQINDIGRQDCYTWFGVNPHDLRRLFLHWRIPATFRTPSRHVYSGEECFIVFFSTLQQGRPSPKWPAILLVEMHLKCKKN